MSSIQKLPVFDLPFQYHEGELRVFNSKYTRTFTRVPSHELHELMRAISKKIKEDNGDSEDEGQEKPHVDLSHPAFTDRDEFWEAQLKLYGLPPNGPREMDRAGWAMTRLGAAYRNNKDEIPIAQVVQMREQGMSLLWSAQGQMVDDIGMAEPAWFEDNRPSYKRKRVVSTGHEGCNGCYSCDHHHMGAADGSERSATSNDDEESVISATGQSASTADDIEEFNRSASGDTDEQDSATDTDATLMEGYTDAEDSSDAETDKDKEEE